MLTVRREKEYNYHWVARDEGDNVVDIDKYSNDMICRHEALDFYNEDGSLDRVARNGHVTYYKENGDIVK